MSYQTGVCNFCGTGCGHLLNLKEGRVRGVIPSAGHPVGRGRLCVRGWHIHELLNSEERIARPLLRRGGILAPASWDEALDAAASALARYRGEEIGFWASPRASNEDVYAMVRLARSGFRSPHISLLSDSGHGRTAGVLAEGGAWPGMLGTLADLRSCDFILVVGTDLTRQNPIIASEIHFAARAGAEVVTISSRTTQMAKLSRTHLRPRPGTKMLVLAALAKTVIEDARKDGEGSAAGRPGYIEFRKTLDAVPLEDFEGRTGIPLDEIRAVARRLAGAKKAAAFFSSGITGPGRDSVALIFDLFLAAGRLGPQDGGVNPITGISNLAGANDMGAAPDRLPGWKTAGDPDAHPILKSLWGTDFAAGAGRPVAELLGDAGSPLKALVVMDHDEEIILQAERIRGLDFVLYLGAYANPLVSLAQAVLPAASFAEADGTYTNTERRIQLNQRKFEPRFEARPAWSIFADLAARRGRSWPFQTAEDVFDEIRQAVPTYAAATYAKLKAAIGGLQWPCDEAHPDGTARFDPAGAPGGLRFVSLSRTFEKSAEASSEFPLLLMAGKSYYYWHQNNIMKKTFIPRREYNALLMLYPQGLVEINAADAGRLGVRDKRPVRVVSALGEMNVAARVTDEVRPGAAYVPYFIGPMIEGFLKPHADVIERGEDGVIPVRIEKV
jgi:predicted molibdopterin-dependent oxidoreductase YjgC